MALNFSQWLSINDEVTAKEIAHWKGLGFTHVIIGAGYHDPAVRQIKTCLSNGFTVDVFRYLWWDEDIPSQVERALRIMQDTGLNSTLYLDCEETQSIPEPSYLVELIQQAVDSVEGVEAGIYSRKEWWEVYAQTNRFSHLPLWDANDKKFEPYGGWLQPRWTQYQWNILLGKRNVDISKSGHL